MRLHLSLIGFIISLSFPASAQTASEKARQSRVMWSAFQCSTFAELLGDQKEQARLFDLGIKAGREFLEAARNKQIPSEIADKEVPMGVIWLMNGPSNDFIIGRVYENALGEAVTQVNKDDNFNDKTLSKQVAHNYYQKGNCVVLK